MDVLNTSFTSKVRYRTDARSYNLYAYFYSFHQKNERNSIIKKKKKQTSDSGRYFYSFSSQATERKKKNLTLLSMLSKTSRYGSLIQRS